MTNYIVTGRTFPHRDLLKAWRAEWNGEGWTLRNPSEPQIAKLRATPGLIVTEYTPPEPEPDEDIDTLIARLIAGDDAVHRHATDGQRKSVMYGDDPSLHNCYADKNPDVFFGFSSLAAYCDYSERFKQHGEDSPARWSGTKNMDEALRLGRQGWPEGAARAQEVADMIGVRHAVQRRRKHGIAGGSVNVGRMLAGNPSHMRQRPRLPGRRVVTLYVEQVCASMIHADTILMRAAVVAAVSDVLEREGYSCEIVVTDVRFKSRRCLSQMAIRVKDAGSRLNMSDVAFALGHPSMLRRLSFAAVCSAPELRSIHATQGLPDDAFTTDSPPPRNSYYVRHVKNNLHSDDALAMLAAVFPDGLELI